jgi:hypothetical protein
VTAIAPGSKRLVAVKAGLRAPVVELMVNVWILWFTGSATKSHCPDESHLCSPGDSRDRCGAPGDQEPDRRGRPGLELQYRASAHVEDVHEPTLDVPWIGHGIDGERGWEAETRELASRAGRADGPCEAGETVEDEDSIVPDVHHVDQHPAGSTATVTGWACKRVETNIPPPSCENSSRLSVPEPMVVA